jgi:PadR family transcriptional regulator
LHRLEEGGLLAGRGVTADSGRRRRIYSLTRRGTRELSERRAVWEQFSTAINSLFKGGRPSHHPA